MPLPDIKVGIIGGGTVGRATARCWLEHCDEVRVWDVLPERRTHGRAGTVACDVVFVCLPEDKLDGFFRLLHPIEERPRNFVIKSTVPVGTTRTLSVRYGLRNLVHSPEFLTERCAVTDAQMPSRNIIGVPGPDDASNNAASLLLQMVGQRFPGVPILRMSSDESEAVKLITNAFFAVKVAFFNEAYTLCDAYGLNWPSVLRGILSDGRIAHSHTQVPGPDGKFGFGGKCLPKDAETFCYALNDRGKEARVVGASLYRNRALDRAGHHRADEGDDRHGDDLDR